MSYRTVIIGFGQISEGFSHDSLMAKYFPFATHAQAIAAHPSFDWQAVVDPCPKALEKAQKDWKIPFVYTDIQQLQNYQPQVAIIATPPESRLGIIKELPSLKAIVVEKPLGTTIKASQAFIHECQERKLLVQVNLWRRADQLFSSLAKDRLKQMIGLPQAIFGIYGNGLINNGTHLVDFIRMLFGNIVSVQTLNQPLDTITPIVNDMDISFNLQLDSGLIATVSPIDFQHYREVSLDIWGQKGRLAIMNEGLNISFHPKCENRALENEWECRYENPQIIKASVGRALYCLYDNLAAALEQKLPLCSPGDSALTTAKIISGIVTSFEKGGAIVHV